jgi:O-antigen ligase|tara:strand:- start:3664 stop:4932 length:1269 start_codon:yes stop_codon:yes gene_type:complete
MNIKLKKYKGLDLSSLLLLLIPIFLITGPFLPDLSLVIIGIIFLYNLITLKKINLFNNNFFKFFIFFYIFILISLFFSEYFLYSLKPSISYIRFGLFAMATSILFSLRNENIVYLVKIFLGILLVLTLDSLIQYFFNSNLLGWRMEDANFRITSLFGDDEVLGSYIARLFPFFLSLLLFARKKLGFNFDDYILYLVLLASIIICFISGERTSFFLILISTIIILFTCSSLRKVILLSLTFAIIIIGTLLIVDKRINNRMLDFTVKQMGLSSSSERIVIFSEIYEGHYKIALNMFKEKPLIGHGVKSFRKYCIKKENYVAENACTTHPHNVYMQLLAETGIISFLIIFSLFVILSFKLIQISYKTLITKNNKIEDYQTLIYIFYTINLFPLAPSGNFFNNWLSIIYYLPSGYLIFLHNPNKND